MTTIDPRLDQQLMAYADGELPPEEAAAVEAQLARDPAARERLRLYLETAALTRAAFQEALREPVPARLLAAVQKATADAAGEHTGRPFAVASRRPWRRWPGLALAAGLAALMVVGWWSLGPGSGDELNRVLARVPAGEQVAGIRPVLTVVTADGRLCRRYRVEREDGAGEGLACREREGDWRVVLWVEGLDQGYAPAGGAAQGPVEAALARLGARILTPEEERRQLQAR